MKTKPFSANNNFINDMISAEKEIYQYQGWYEAKHLKMKYEELLRADGGIKCVFFDLITKIHAMSYG